MFCLIILRSDPSDFKCKYKSWMYEARSVLLVELYPNRLDSGLALRGLLGSSSPLPTSPVSLKEALWMIWARWRPRCSRAFSRLRDDFLCKPPLVFSDSSGVSGGEVSSRSDFRLPWRTLGNLQPLVLLLPPFAFSVSDSGPGEVTNPSLSRSAASSGERYWMARLPL